MLKTSVADLDHFDTAQYPTVFCDRYGSGSFCMKFKSSVLSYPYITDGGAGVGVVYSFVRDRIYYQRMYYMHAIYLIGV
jgi:hypothetical protein